MLSNSGCVQCGELNEDIHHTLFSCPHAKLLWTAASRRWSQMFRGEDDLINIFLFMSSAGCEVFAEFIMLCWDLWYSRNKKFHDNEDIQPETIIKLVHSLLGEHRRANHPAQFEDNTLSAPNGKWRAPPSGVTKVNSVASWRGANQSAGLGFVCRNSEGTVLIAGARTGMMVSSVLEAEARGVLYALESSLQRGLTRCVIEMDSLCLVRALVENKCIRSIANVLNAIKRAARQASSCEWSFVRRNGNQVAHELVAWAIRMNQSRLFVDELPRVVEEAVCSDIALL